MDRVLLFDQGAIAQDGTNAILLTSDRLYKTLWDAQVGGFLPDKSEGQL
jgi:ATP-binding cassette, subfamily B, bacterial